MDSEKYCQRHYLTVRWGLCRTSSFQATRSPEGVPVSSLIVHAYRMNDIVSEVYGHWNRHATRCTRKRNMRSKIWWFTEFCNSHYVSHFAAFFIVVRAKISVAVSCKIFGIALQEIIKFRSVLFVVTIGWIGVFKFKEKTINGSLISTSRP